MSGVTYHGEYPLEQVDGEGNPFIEQHGYIFNPGKSVDVKDKDVLAKFARNRFFKTADSDKEVVERGQSEADKAEAETLTAWLKDHQVPVHHKMKMDTLRGLKADYEKAQLKAQEA